MIKRDALRQEVRVFLLILSGVQPCQICWGIWGDQAILLTENLP